MMIAPVVFCTIVSGITSLNDSKEIGKTLLKSMGLFYVLTILALFTGLAAVMLMQPGEGMHIDPKHLDAAVAAKFGAQVPPKGFSEFVLHIIPTSFFGAFAEVSAASAAGGRDDVQHELREALGWHLRAELGRYRGVQMLRIDVHAFPRLHQHDRRQPGEQRQDRQHIEQPHRLQEGLADLL